MNGLGEFRMGKVAETRKCRKFSREGTLYMEAQQLVSIFCNIEDFCNELAHYCQNLIKF
jgi:hypothetical protein